MDAPPDRTTPPDASTCGSNGCGPLLIGDLTAIDVSTAPGFDAVGFRCKAFIVCGVGMTCFYFASPGQPPPNLGHRQSADSTYNDGTTATPAVATKIWITNGAQSMCTGAQMTLTAGSYVTLTYDGKSLKVYLPAFMGTELTLYASMNGSTFKDQALTQLAAAPP
jgi:hypothetical protein